MYDVSIAKEEKEVHEAYELFYRSFGKTYYDAKDAFDLSKSIDPTLKTKNVFVMKNEYGTVIGAARTVERDINISGESFHIGGIATTALHPKYRGEGLFTKLTDFVLDNMAKRKLSLCLVFARRNIDNIYVKHGFWGTPVERNYVLLNPPEIITKNYWFRRATESDIPLLEKMYRKVYGNLPVYLERPEYLWRIKLQEGKGTRFYGYVLFDLNSSSESPIGYLFTEHNKIIELAADSTDPSIYKTMLFSNISPVSEFAKQGFSVPLTHPAITEMQGEPYSIYTRHPTNGGNILRILDKDPKIKSMLRKSLQKWGFSEGEIRSVIGEPDHVQMKTAALFGYETKDTKKVFGIPEESRLNKKPMDFILSGLDDF